MDGCDLITALPASLSALILSQYLKVVEVAALDSALCRRASRTRYLDVLQNPAAVFTPTSSEFDSLLVNWLLSRKMMVASLVLTDELAMHDLHSYLPITVTHLTKLTILDIEDADDMSLLLDSLCQYSGQFTDLSFIGCFTPPSFKDIMSHATNLERLVISHSCNCYTLDSLVEIYAPRLRSFMLVCGNAALVGGHTSYINPEIFQNMSSLTSLVLADALLTNESAEQIARYCPNLTALSLPGMADPSAIYRMAALCPHIQHLDCILDTDTLEQIVVILPLVSLRINNGFDLGRDAMRAIATHLPNTLQALYIANNTWLNINDVIEIVHKCSKLKLLEFEVTEMQQQFVDKVFISQLSQLRAISIICEAPQYIYAHTVKLIAKHCTRLVHLRINTPKVLHSELNRLVQKCGNLRTLHLNAWNLTRVKAWRLINPLCSFEDIDSECDIKAFDLSLDM